MSDELRTCPFCNEFPDSMLTNVKNIKNEWKCPKCSSSTDEWNLAYCWKLIKELEEKVEELKNEISLKDHDETEREIIKIGRDLEEAKLRFQAARNILIDRDGGYQPRAEERIDQEIEAKVFKLKQQSSSQS